MTYRNRRAWAPASVTLRDGRGPERVSVEDPPADWRPPAPAGFAPPDVHRAAPAVGEPLLWDGDQA